MYTFSFLRRALWANAIFSGLTGLLLLMGGAWLIPLLGVPSQLYALVVGIGLLFFAMGLVQNARSRPIDVRRVRLSLSIDIVWLLGTVLLLALPDLPLTPTGRTALVAVGLVVALMALLQAVGLSREDEHEEQAPAFGVERLIQAPPERVWRVLADIGTIARWNPGVVASHETVERSGGLGAERYCDLGGGNYVQEKVVTWEPQRRLTMRVVESNLPFAAVDIAFRLRRAGAGTCVTVAPTYRLRYGPVGRLLDRFYMRARYRRSMEALLEGLREDVEGVDGQG